jgi:hypothetical protein
VILILAKLTLQGALSLIMHFYPRPAARPASQTNGGGGGGGGGGAVDVL